MANQIQELIEKAKTQFDPEERNKTIKEIARLDRIEREKRSQDLIMVHNIDIEDYVVVWDKSGANLRYLIPNKNKDLGEGKGNKTVPRFIADKFMKEVIVKVITKTSEKDFAVKAKKYNGNWLAGYEEQQAIRTNNSGLWEKYAKEIWLGVVSVFGETDIEIEEEKIVDTKNMQDDILKKLNLDDKKYEANKNNFIKEVSGETKAKTVEFISNK